MDPAICGYCRSGYCRCGVYDPVFDEMLARFKNQSTPHKRVMDGEVAKMDEGPKLRMDVCIPTFEEVLNRFKKGT